MDERAQDDVIWHEWDPFYQVLKVAFVDQDSISVFTYRLCLECGVSMEREELADCILWTCSFCGSEAREL